MGPSGAGKSTLMDILAMRKSLGNLSGSLMVNGQDAPASFIKKTSYVPQVGCGCVLTQGAKQQRREQPVRVCLGAGVGVGVWVVDHNLGGWCVGRCCHSMRWKLDKRSS
jgi:hypothetical protein